MTYTIHNDDESVSRALSLCKGDYQRDLILGIESLSGATLQGKAKQFSGKYKKSRDAILNRMTNAGIPWREITGPRNRRILVIGKES
jgi:hypothetical protein